jgi:D-glycero-D-manno-heptose 1,7-bisphosphate phosphatase
MSDKRKALFLDRDGVINIDYGYVHKIENFHFTDGIFDFLEDYRDYLLIVITNQSGISRGYYSEEQFSELTAYMIGEFQKRGFEIAKVYHCPHHPDFSESWECRKPNPYMILEAEMEFNIDLEKSVLIGDSRTDIEAGRSAGVGRNLLIEKNNISNLLPI